MATLKNTAINDTGYLRIPVGTTAQRLTAVSGDMRYNTTRGMIEIYNGTTWVGIGQLEASGGSVVTTGGYRIHTFTSPGTFVAASGSTAAELLVIAGGGSGGSGTGGGGGAGGVLYNGSFAISAGSYSVVTGSGGPFRPGGVTQGISGSPSVFGPQTAIGGGYGGNTGPGIMNAAASGGSGGGSAGYPGSPQGYGPGAAGTPGQGNPGGTTAGYGGGGGGGVGGAGQPGNGGFGGPGANYSTTGSSASYAGGGGGSTDVARAAPGSGGGGAGNNGGGPGNNATYYGGGGGGSWDYGNAGAGAGYQGIVVVRYPYG